MSSTSNRRALFVALTAVVIGGFGWWDAATGGVANAQAIEFGGRLSYFEPLQAADSYELVYDSGDLALGFVVSWDIGDRAAVDFALDYFTKDGERVDAGSLEPTGIGTTLTLIPLTVSGRFKIVPEGNPVVPYVGGGLGYYMLTLEDEVNDVDRTGAGYHLMGGVELQFLDPVQFDVQLRYNSVPGIIGNEGTSELYDEDDIGGVWFTVGVSYVFR